MNITAVILPSINIPFHMKKVFPVVVLLVIAIVVIYSLQGGESKESYRERIQDEREKTARFMKVDDESPFAPDSISFSGLKYYDIDQAYAVKARLEPIQEQKLMVLPTSTGKEEKYIRYGYAHFELNGKDNRLLVLQPFESKEPQQLFIAFADETSGEETYGGGRYLNVEMPTRTGQKTLELDFNLAYNPYCAYNASFSCPLPPRENVLDIPIRAGEKNYE